MKDAARKLDAVQRRRMAADMSLEGWSQEASARFLEVAQARVSRDRDDVHRPGTGSFFPQLARRLGHLADRGVARCREKCAGTAALSGGPPGFAGGRGSRGANGSVDVGLESRDIPRIVARASDGGSAFRPDGFAVETIPFQSLLGDEMNRVAAERHVTLPRNPVENRVSNLVRIRRLIPGFREPDVYVGENLCTLEGCHPLAGGRREAMTPGKTGSQFRFDLEGVAAPGRVAMR